MEGGRWARGRRDCRVVVAVWVWAGGCLDEDADQADDLVLHQVLVLPGVLSDIAPFLVLSAGAESDAKHMNHFEHVHEDYEAEPAPFGRLRVDALDVHAVGVNLVGGVRENARNNVGEVPVEGVRPER